VDALGPLEFGRPVEQDGTAGFEAVGRQPRRVLVDSREVPGRVGLVPALGQFRGRRLDDRFDVAGPTHLRDEPAAGDERVGERRQHVVVVLVGDPVQHRVREDGVERLLNLEAPHVGLLDGEGRVLLACALDHLAGGVDAVDRRAVLGNLGGEVARPTAHVEDPLPRFGIEQFQHAPAVLVDVAVLVVVRVGVPLVCLGHGRIVVGLGRGRIPVGHSASASFTSPAISPAPRAATGSRPRGRPTLQSSA
jgi:hypothetical protein